MENLVKKIQNSVFQNGLFSKNSKILVAVSGGPDSVCLLDILLKLKPKYSLELAVAHVNYGLRGPESDKDEEFVRKLAEKNNLEIFTLTPTLSLKRARGKMPSENKLRDTRYDFFEKSRAELNYDCIAVAHNLDDQVETFLMRLIRGSGLQGLSGMQFKNGKIIRPLLGTTRKDILDYLKLNNLKYRTDKTNLEPIYLRNKIRLKLIPYIEKNFNPSIKSTLFSASRSIGEDYALISEISKKTIGTKKDSLSVKGILKLSPSLQKRTLREAILEKKTDLKNIDAAHIEEMLKAMKSSKGKSQKVSFQGLKMTRKGDKINLEVVEQD